eukprot:TRINITY_DN35662_c0_g1_i1.p1 TRINITY_DN35662_c0_g1~~TRINITY_DN35662_c0_g1_i1.p1  ORF type:complete len:241 (+),score=67.26 TRINITY_DN35662_c0_g1_i1:152-874(+)
MKAFPLIKGFWDGRGKEFPSVELKSRPGLKYPEMHWLNKHYETVGRPYVFGPHSKQQDPADVLQKRGFTKETPAPEFVEREFEPTAHCRSMRMMLPDGSRPKEVLPFDVPCGQSARTGHRAVCHCTGGHDIDIAQSTNAAREAFTCEEKCRAELNPGAEPEEPQPDAKEEAAEDDVAAQVRDLVERRAPQRAKKLPALLRAWRGRERALLASLRRELGEEEPKSPEPSQVVYGSFDHDDL